MTLTMPGRCMIALLLLLPAIAQSASLPGQDGPYAFAGGLYEFPDSHRHSDDGIGGWIGGGWNLPGHPGEALEISLRGLTRDRHDHGSDQQYGLFAHWTKNFLGGALGDAQPFLLLGLGGVQEEVENHGDLHFGMDGGVGLLVPLGSAGWALRAETALQAEINNDSVPHRDYLLDVQVRLGLQIPFGSASPSEPEAPGRTRTETETPIECPVKVTDPVTGRSECGSDSDGDHVLDGNDMCPGTPSGTEVDSKGCAVAAAGDADGDGVLDAADACPETTVGMKVDATGCVVDQTTTLKGVRFETGSARLTPEARKILDDVARTLKNQPSLHADISGHTDDAGNDAYNLILSQQRAESVRQHLIGRGVSPDRLTAQGYGETQPVAPNDTPQGRDLNRRVDIKVRNS